MGISLEQGETQRGFMVTSVCNLGLDSVPHVYWLFDQRLETVSESQTSFLRSRHSLTFIMCFI